MQKSLLNMDSLKIVDQGDLSKTKNPMEEGFSCAVWFFDFQEISFSEMEVWPSFKKPNLWIQIYFR